MCLGCDELSGSVEGRAAFIKAGVVSSPWEGYSQLRVMSEGGGKRALSEPVDAFGAPLRRQRVSDPLQQTAFRTRDRSYTAIPVPQAPPMWWRRFPPPPHRCFACHSGVLFPVTTKDNPEASYENDRINLEAKDDQTSAILSTGTDTEDSPSKQNEDKLDAG